MIPVVPWGNDCCELFPTPLADSFLFSLSVLIVIFDGAVMGAELCVRLLSRELFPTALARKSEEFSFFHALFAVLSVPLAPFLGSVPLACERTDLIQVFLNLVGAVVSRAAMLRAR
jgi:hypothetical protein